MSPETDELSCFTPLLWTWTAQWLFVLEMGKFTWMLNAIVPGVDRRPLKKAASQ